MNTFILPAVVPTHQIDLAEQLHNRINNKTKPIGSLGQLEQLALQVGLIQQSANPVLTQAAIIVFAADHGVVAEGVSAYPQSVTWQMVENFLSEGAAINVFAKQNGIALYIVDAGVNHEFGVRAGLLDRKIAPGTQNFAQQSAMSAQQCAEALQHGADLVAALPGNVLGFGEMGIGNTTSAAALMHALSKLPVSRCVGAGTVCRPKAYYVKNRSWHVQHDYTRRSMHRWMC